MKYARQTQDALDRLDEALAQLRGLISRGDNQSAIRFMDEGALKERFEELQNMIILSQTNNLGAMGTSQTGRI